MCCLRMPNLRAFACVYALLLSLSGVVSCLAEELTVTFRLTAPDLAEDSTVFITGSLTGLGNWRPDEKQMTYAGEHVWEFTLPLAGKRTIEYKYTLGSWSREGADATGLPLKNFALTTDQSTVAEDRIDFWTKPRTHEVHGQITGTVRYHLQLGAENVRHRDVIVWLPPGYEESDERYPVLYMQDGQNIVDPKTSAFGVDWQIDETCTRLIEEQTIPPLIVVGIYNTPARNQEYLLGKKGEAYRRFVADKVKPLIDGRYRTKPSREHAWVGGSSAGGLCAFILAWEHSDVFSKALCMSPAFKLEIAERSLFLDYVATVEESERPAESLAFYIDNGGVGLEKILQPGIDEMLEALREHGYQQGRDLWWVHAPDARHSESAWAERFSGAIKLLSTSTIP